MRKLSIGADFRAINFDAFALSLGPQYLTLYFDLN
jgi:hypothetical protein